VLEVQNEIEVQSSAPGDVALVSNGHVTLPGAVASLDVERLQAMWRAGARSVAIQQAQGNSVQVAAALAAAR